MADSPQDFGSTLGDDSPPEPTVELQPLASGRKRSGPLVAVLVLGFVALVVVVIVLTRSSGDDIDGVATEPFGAEDRAADETPASADTDPASGAGDDGSGVGADDIGFEAAAEGASMDAGGSDWLVPWGDGFLRFGLVYQPQPLPEITDQLAERLPTGAIEVLEESGATTIDDATRALEAAGLYDETFDVLADDPDLFDYVFGSEPPPPTFEIATTTDGSTWTPVDGASIPGGEAIVWVDSDGERLAVGSQTYDMEPGSNRGTTMVRVAITDDLIDWDVYDITNTADLEVPELVHVDTSLAGVALGPNGWVAATNSYAWLDEWALLPPEIRDTEGWWETTADESGLTVTVYAPEDGSYGLEDEPVPESGTAETDALDPPAVAAGDIESCCEPVETRFIPWSELDTDYDTWRTYRDEGEQGSMSVWTATWGEAPARSTLPDEIGNLSSLVATDAGFVATSWARNGGANSVIHSPDGRNWSESESPTSDGRWIDQLVAIDGGLLALGGSELGQTVFVGEADGTDWRPTGIPGAPASAWVWFSPASGAAAVADFTDYSLVDHQCYGGLDHMYVELDLPGGYVQLETGPEGAWLIAENGENQDFAEVWTETYNDDGTPGFVTIDAGTDEVVIVEPESQDEVARLPRADFFREWDAAVTRQAELEIECEGVGEYPTGDHWLVATADGVSWLVEDLDDGSDSEPYPQQAALNGDTVLARRGEAWSSHSLPGP